MRLVFAAVLAFFIPSLSVAFVSPSPKILHNNAISTTDRPDKPNLKLSKNGINDADENSTKDEPHIIPLVAVLAGLTFASQTAGAYIGGIPLEQAAPLHHRSSTEVMSSVATPADLISIQIAASNSQDFLDFSLPSYGDSVGSSSAPKKDAPTFDNPFKDFDFNAPKTDSVAEAPEVTSQGDVNKEAEDQAKKAEAEAAKQAKAEREAEEKAKKAEAKAAAELAKQQRKEEEAKAREEKRIADEEAVAQKRAEKEARREAEREKQRLAVERANAEKAQKEADATSAVASLEQKDVAADDGPAFTVPDVKIPEFKVPSFSGFKAPDTSQEQKGVAANDGPAFTVPDVKVPEFKAPSFSGFKAPDIKAPEYSLDIPDFKAPDVKVPEVSLPKFSLPKIDIPKVEIPQPAATSSAPSFSVPSSNVELPKVSVPKFSAPSIGSGRVSNDVAFDGESQELRDERAKEARSAFNDADSTARDYEKKAKQLRDIANDKKRIAKDAKNEACETRFGGKLLCIRPFGIGY